MTPKRFLIVGSQRTGTTLMRLVLESHTRVSCLDEDDSYLALADKADRLPVGKTLVGYKIPRWTEQLADSHLSDFGHEIEADHFYAGEAILFMLRDVRDTVASMLRLQTGEGSWLVKWGIPILRDKIGRSDSFRTRFAREIELLAGTTGRQHVWGALYWKYKTMAYFDYLDSGLRVHGVRYEELVTSPEPHLKTVLGYLGLQWEEGVLDHPSHWHTALDPAGFAAGGTDPRKPIHGQSVSTWDQHLTHEDECDVMQIGGDLNDRLSAPQTG